MQTTFIKATAAISAAGLSTVAFAGGGAPLVLLLSLGLGP